MVKRELRNAKRAGTAGGYALIAALILVIMASLATTVAVNSAQLDAQRERELQLLFVGNQFRNALASYYASGAGGVTQFPETLQQLLIDERWPQARHHLRKLWSDPITNSPDWVLVRSQGRIVGVHSRSTAAPLKRANFGEGNDFAQAKSYADWVFAARESNRPESDRPPSPEKPPPPDAKQLCIQQFITASAVACQQAKTIEDYQACKRDFAARFADCMKGAQ